MRRSRIYIIYQQSEIVKGELMEIYVVRGGDSLYGIARRYGTDAAELARINQLNDPARLVPGMALLVP